MRRTDSIAVAVVTFVAAVAVAQEDGPKRDWVVAPVVSASPSLGDGLGLSGFYFFQLDKDNPATPPSRIFASLLYTNTDSYFGVVVPSLYFRNDARRFEMPIAFGRINNDINDFLTGAPVKFETKLAAFAPVFRWRVRQNTFLGVQGAITDLRYSPEDQFSADYLKRVGAEDTTQYGIGAVLTRDTRDNQLYPFSGSYAEANFIAYPDFLDNDTEYEQLKLEFKKFHELRTEHILAWRLYSQFAFGDTAYAGKATLGRFGDLRGYTAGELLGDNLITAQAEYRWLAWRRLGFVGFVGYSAIYDGKWYDVRSDGLHGSAGFGLRLRILKSQRVNLRIDFAWGKSQDAYYVSLREAF